MRESEVFLMRNTKRELNPYSFYDTEGLARHFERMAAVRESNIVISF